MTFSDVLHFLKRVVVFTLRALLFNNKMIICIRITRDQTRSDTQSIAVVSYSFMNGSYGLSLYGNELARYIVVSKWKSDQVILLDQFNFVMVLCCFFAPRHNFELSLTVKCFKPTRKCRTKKIIIIKRYHRIDNTVRSYLDRQCFTDKEKKTIQHECTRACVYDVLVVNLCVLHSGKTT